MQDITKLKINEVIRLRIAHKLANSEPTTPKIIISGINTAKKTGRGLTNGASAFVTSFLSEFGYIKK
jgi:hypothetical protein